MNSKKLLPWAKPLLISSTLAQATIYVLRPMITYRAIELHANPVQIGLIASLYALFPIVLALQFGKLIGRLGESKFIISGIFALVATSAGLIFANSIIMLCVAAALAGLSHLACVAGAQSMVALRAPESGYDRYFGLYTFSASLGHMIAPIAATLVAGSAGNMPKSISHAFALAVLFAVLALLPILKWRNEKPSVNAKDNNEGTFNAAVNLLKRPGMGAAIYISIAISSAADILVVFLPLIGTEYNFSPYAIGIILSIRAGTTMLSRFYLGWLSQRFTTFELLRWSSIVSVLACIAMAFSHSTITLGLVVFIAGLSLGVGQPLTMSLVAQKTLRTERALAVSLRLMGNRVGQFLVPLGAGALATLSGAGSVFIGLAALLGSSLFSVKKE
jgi:MFS family permease